MIENYASNLETALKASPLIDALEIKWRDFLKEAQLELPEAETLRTLRSLKVFLQKRREDRLPITKGTVLDHSDCNTMASLACMLAHRNQVETVIARPAQWSRYLHAVLIDDNENIYKITGKSPTPKAIPMSIEEVQMRLTWIKPFIRVGNAVRDKI
jgi:hypothetical protein